MVFTSDVLCVHVTPRSTSRAMILFLCSAMNAFLSRSTTSFAFCKKSSKEIEKGIERGKKRDRYIDRERGGEREKNRDKGNTRAS